MIKKITYIDPATRDALLAAGFEQDLLKFLTTEDLNELMMMLNKRKSRLLRCLLFQTELTVPGVAKETVTLIKPDQQVMGIGGMAGLLDELGMECIEGGDKYFESLHEFLRKDENTKYLTAALDAKIIAPDSSANVIYGTQFLNGMQRTTYGGTEPITGCLGGNILILCREVGR